MKDKDILKWHKETFPNVTLTGQLLKLDEELREMFQTKTIEEYFKELADVYIIATVLDLRFDSYVGWVVIEHLSKMIDFEKLSKYVEDKMRINRLRKWRIVDGVYLHVESGEK